MSKEALKQEQGEPVAREWPIRGYGNVAIGGGRNKADGSSYLLYLKLDEPREINADTTDVFPVGQEAPQEKLLACVYFKDGAAIQQTIEVLQGMQTEIGYTTPQQPKQEQGEPVETFDEVWDSIDWDEWRMKSIRDVVKMIHSKTHPQQRKPLTDEQAIIIKGSTCPAIDWNARHGVEMNNGERNEWLLSWFMAFKDAIEAAHGIKE